MDAWWPRAARGRVQARDGHSVLRCGACACSGFDNEPNNHGDHLGSAYQGGWWGYVSKDLRRVLGQPRLGRLLAHVLRQRLADRLPRRAAPGARRCARACPRPPLRRGPRHRRHAARGHMPRRQERPVVLRLRPLPPDRRRHGPHDPLDQPARPTSRPSRSRATARAATRGPWLRARSARRSCPPTAPAAPQTACTGRRSRSAPAVRRVQRSDHLTVGTSDANGNAPRSVGYMRLGGIPRQPVHVRPMKPT